MDKLKILNKIYSYLVKNVGGAQEITISPSTDPLTVKQATHDNLNCNANIQVEDSDITSTNPLPVSITGSTEDSENIITAVNIATLDVTWEDKGIQLVTKGYNKCAIWINYTANDSIGAKLRVIARHADSGIDYKGSSDPIFEITLDTEPRWYDFDLENVLPYLQLQTYVTTVGTTAGVINIDITKG